MKTIRLQILKYTENIQTFRLILIMPVVIETLEN